jgi:hypothetical protein
MTSLLLPNSKKIENFNKKTIDSQSATFDMFYKKIYKMYKSLIIAEKNRKISKMEFGKQF